MRHKDYYFYLNVQYLIHNDKYYYLIISLSITYFAEIIRYAMDVAKNIRATREKKGLKQTDMAERLSMERSNYSRLEKRGNDLSVSQVTLIAEALEVDAFDLLFPEESRKLKRAVGRLEKLEEQNAYMLSNQRKIEAFMNLVTELGHGFEGMGLTKEVFQKQLDPDGKLEQWAKEKIDNFSDEM